MINFRAIKVIYLHEMLRFWQTLFQSVASPILSTALYFVVFGAAIGSRIANTNEDLVDIKNKFKEILIQINPDTEDF